MKFLLLITLLTVAVANKAHVGSVDGAAERRHFVERGICGYYGERCSALKPCCRMLQCNSWGRCETACSSSGQSCSSTGIVSPRCCGSLHCVSGRCASCARSWQECSYTVPCCSGLTCKWGSGGASYKYCDPN